MRAESPTWKALTATMISISSTLNQKILALVLSANRSSTGQQQYQEQQEQQQQKQQQQQLTRCVPVRALAGAHVFLQRATLTMTERRKTSIAFASADTRAND